MKYHNALTDDAGVKWEFSYEEDTRYEQDDEGEWQRIGTVVRDLKYRREGDETYVTLPPWADIRDEWKLNLCLFDEDEETGELTYWEIIPTEEPS